ncbi:hypothetical protein [Streptomyces sp. NPDC102437]|uniref:hypothetical protein n=1 Tax=Streptomyces sp. NPDC102437 TaxID=3366175 RepID=UPI00381E0C13
MSTDTKVRALQPDWGDTTVAEEVARIDEETGQAAPTLSEGSRSMLLLDVWAGAGNIIGAAVITYTLTIVGIAIKFPDGAGYECISSHYGDCPPGKRGVEGPSCRLAHLCGDDPEPTSTYQGSSSRAA